MKKRKPPIILITCMVVFAAGAFMFNQATSQSQNGQEPTPPPPPPANSSPEQGKPRAAQSPSSIAGAVKSQMGSAKPGPAAPQGSAAAAQFAAKMPSMEVRASTENKPKPNESSISTQWYSDKSNLGSK